MGDFTNPQNGMDLDNEITSTQNDNAQFSEPVKDMFTYEYFKMKLFSNEGIPIKKLISEFYKDFEQKTQHTFSNPDEQSQYLRSNLIRLCNALLGNPLWANCNEKEKECAIVYMEMVITKKLYYITFAVLEDLKKDELLSKKIFLHSWVEPHHLNLPNFDVRIFEKAGEELENMNNFKFYLDKISCIVKCLKNIEDAYNQNLSDKEPLTNDKVLHILIFIIIKMDPKKLVSNFNYIDRYINRNFLSNALYDFSLTSMRIAISYIEKLSQESLTITYEEYYTKTVEMSRMENERFVESNIEAELFSSNSIDRGNSSGSFIQSIQSIGSSVGSAIGSFFGGDSSAKRLSMGESQGYFDNLERERSVNRNGSLTDNIAIDHQRSIQERQNNNGGVQMSNPFTDEQFTEEEQKNLPKVDESLKASLSICSNKDNMNED